MIRLDWRMSVRASTNGTPCRVGRLEGVPAVGLEPWTFANVRLLSSCLSCFRRVKSLELVHSAF